MIEELFCQELCLGEDLVFNLNFLTNCDRIVIIPDKVYNYFQEDNTLSTRFRISAFDMIRKVYCETGRICKKLELKWPITQVDEKYVLDTLVLLEKYVYAMEVFLRIEKLARSILP